jgi:deazaflavin-dependent oxidoreductase (nitroreductase family)
VASLIDLLGYRLPQPLAWQRALRAVAASRPGSWLFSRVLPRVDRLLLRMSGGRLAVPALAAGIPVLTLVTTGARSGAPRTTPLLGIPHGDEIAVIGTQFGQPGTPSWYFNLRAHPRAEVHYRGRSAAAVAREVEGDEWDAVWRRACSFYAGYAAYARRIKGRPIHIMALRASASGPPASPTS